MLRVRALRQVRPWTQTAAFLLMVVALVGAGGATGVPGDLFLRLDPLVSVAGMLAARQTLPALLVWTLATLLLTLIMGRVWCGWLCPLGTLLDWIPSRRPSRDETDLAPAFRQAKYSLLVLTGGAALLGNLTLLVFDPITIVYRTVAVAAWPAVNAVAWQAERALYAVPPLRGAVDLVERTARGVVLPATPPAYGQALAVALVFAGIVALNTVRPRFWCRYLCPLGALLGLVSKVAWLRRTVSARCTDCLRCARTCPVGTIDPHRGYASDPSECTMCLDCVPVCPKDGQQFTWHRRPASWRPYDPSRRQFLTSLGTAVATVGLFGIEPAAGREADRLIRPPGARRPEFLSQCVRCTLCIKVCPTSGLQPSLTEAGWVGFWTPVLVPRVGHCDFSCNACGQICPTGAIPPLPLPEKRRVVIGVAYIDRDRCLPWADARTCLVCEEMCPLPDKAIRLEEVTATGPDGAVVPIKRPHVLRDVCTGCGICENRCPVGGESAIRVSAPTDLILRQ